MNAPIPIEYRDYWDVPRIFLARHQGRLYLFDCEFDETLEDFRQGYRVYLMPEISTEDREGSWAEFPKRAIRELRTIEVGLVSFANAEKSMIDSSIIDNLIGESTRRIA